MASRALVLPAVLVAIASAFTPFVACSRAGSTTSADANRTNADRDQDASRTDPAEANGNGPGDASSAARDDGGGASRDPGPPRVRLVGRFDTHDPSGPTCGWPGCRIIASFSGTEVKARLDEHVDSWMEGGPSEWDVVVDGVIQPKLVLDLGAHDYVLASGLAPKPHVIELYKRSETQNGYTQFLGYDFGEGTLLPPPLAPTRRIEIVGDSAVAGFGIEGVGLGPDCPGPDWAARWQNFHKSVGARLGEIFGADLDGTVYSGKGMVRNIFRSDPDTMPIIYPRANPVIAGSVFDFTQFVPDVIVVMLGGNDFAIGQDFDNGPTPVGEFTQAMHDFVATLRSHAPLALVLLALSPSVSDDNPPGHQSRTSVKQAFDAVAAQSVAAGDKRVYSVAPPVAVPSELTACNGHGTPAYHDRVAQQLAVVIREKIGW
jgi:lysophospholipase L1-like esterase